MAGGCQAQRWSSGVREAGGVDDKGCQVVGRHIEHCVRERTDGSGRHLMVEAGWARGPRNMDRAYSEGISHRQLT